MTFALVLALTQVRGLDSDYGPVLACTLARAATDRDADVIAHKALVLRLEHGVTAAFDTDSCRFVQVWTGGWVDLKGSLFASNTDSVSVRPSGIPLLSMARGPRARFLGFTRRGIRVTLRYRIGDLEVHDTPRAPSGDSFVRDLRLGPGAAGIPVGDAPHLSGGPFRSVDGVPTLVVSADARRDWTILAARAPVEVGPDKRPEGALWNTAPSSVSSSRHGPFDVDSFSIPEPNPWKAWIRPTAVDVFPDGRIAVASLNGDVFLVTDREWRRFAAGLNQPLGLKIVDGLIHVRGRDQITRLRDADGDGEADEYECFNNDGAALANYQDFAFDLETDADGDFYWSRNGNVAAGKPEHGCVFRTTKAGDRSEVFASGLRAPCGMSMGPDGTLTVSDQQGQWVPASKICVVRRGGYYGHAWTALGADPGRPERPLCWLPREVDNSSGGQTWVPKDAWGPLAGELLHFSYGTSSLFHVLRDGAQAAVVRLPIGFDSGVIRGRFHGDALYAVGLRGWQTNSARDAGVYRVRRSPRAHTALAGWSAIPGGMELRFTAPPKVDVDAFTLSGWNYRISEAYGSEDYSLRDPKRRGRDTLEISAAAVAGHVLRLTIPDLSPMMQFHLKGRADGFSLDLYGTIHEVPR